MSDEMPPDHGHLRVVRGEPTPEELAALTAIVSAARSGPDAAAAEPPCRGRWSDPAWAHRHAWLAGPGGWHAAVR